MFRVLLLLLSLVLTALPIDAAFTHLAQWRLDVIMQTDAGSWCYHPGASSVSHHRCTNETLKAVLDIHINNQHGPGLSIAYYDLADLSILGGAGWASWDAVPLPVVVCMAGAVDDIDDAYRTFCRFTVADNDHSTPAAHTEECGLSRAQFRVIDGCYTPPRRAGFRLDDSTSGVLTIMGLLIVLPGMVFSAYRWYCARRALRSAWLRNEQAIPLAVANDNDGGRSLSQGQLFPEPAHSQA